MFSQSLIVFSLLLIPFSYCSKAYENCNGTSWIKFDGNCYLFQSTSQARVSYYDAEDFCRSQGAHLASIHSNAEHEFIMKTMQERRLGDRLWIGLNTLAGKKDFRWSDGSPVDFSKTVNKEFYVNEKCFIMMRSQKGWRPEHCALHYAPVCKKSEGASPTPVPPITVPGYCPEGWIQWGEKCYKYYGAVEEERLQYKQARDACWALGNNHDLVSIHSMQEQSFLTQHLYSLNTSAWIGMRQVTSDEIGHDLVFGWIDNSRTDFTYWEQGNPPPGTWKYCARLSFEGVSKGKWIADYCEINKQGYICQRPSDPKLPPPVIKPSKCGSDPLVAEYRNACYQIVAKPQSQQNAEETCKGIGGHLVSIVDSLEESFLINFMGMKSSELWSGLRTSENTRYLKWTDNQPVYYSNFVEVEGKLQLPSAEKSCISLDVTKYLKWRATDCSLELPFVCKITNEIPPSFPEVLGLCPNDRNLYVDIGDDFCYHIAENKFHIQSWDATSRYCLTKGMKTTTAYSDHQMHSLAAYLHQETYGVHLGLVRSPDTDSFIWTNGNALNYTNWDVREPSSYPGTKDCVAFHQSTGKWRTISCSEGGVATCQILKTKSN